MAEARRLFIALYTDEDITGELALALRERGFDSQSAAEAGMLNADDESQLVYAASRGMVLLTSNAHHFAVIAKRFAEVGRPHAGIILSSEQFGRRHFGELLRLVLNMLNTLTADDMRNGVVYLQQYRHVNE